MEEKDEGGTGGGYICEVTGEGLQGVGDGLLGVYCRRERAWVGRGTIAINIPAASSLFARRFH